MKMLKNGLIGLKSRHRMPWLSISFTNRKDSMEAEPISSYRMRTSTPSAAFWYRISLIGAKLSRSSMAKYSRKMECSAFLRSSIWDSLPCSASGKYLADVP